MLLDRVNEPPLKLQIRLKKVVLGAVECAIFISGPLIEIQGREGNICNNSLRRM